MKGNEAKDMILKDCPDCNVIVMNEVGMFQCL